MYTMNRNMTNTFLLVILMVMNAACSTTNRKSAVDIKWNDTLVMPGCSGMEKNVGLAGAFSGVVGDKLVIVGGANFPNKYPWEGGTKVWWPTLYSYDLNSTSWTVQDHFLTSPLAYGVSIGLPEGLLCIGGCDKDQCSDKVQLIKYDNHSFVIDSLSYPPLPVPLANASGTILGDRIYIAGGQESMKNEKSAKHFFMFDLKDQKSGWQVLPQWEGASRGYAVCVAQDDKIYLFGGRSYGPDEEMKVQTDGFVYDPATGKWRILTGEYPVMAGTALPYQSDKILFFGGVEKLLPASAQHPGFSHEVRVFHAKVDSIEASFTCPFAIPVTTNVVRHLNTFYITSGEIQPGIRTPNILKGEFIEVK